jgi:RNA polymerase sigma-70 factor (ECF subfamily)
MSDRRTAWTEIFLRHLPAPIGESADPTGPLGELLAGMVEKARGQWSALGHDPELFLADLARKVPEGASLEEFLRSLWVADLFLASACAHGVPGAIAAFEAEYFGEVDAALLDAKVPHHLIEEIKQILRERFFVTRLERQPAVATFNGRGSLRAWVRISAMREVFRHGGAQKRWVQLEEDQLSEMAAPVDDPELGFLKKRYRVEFRKAFDESFATLSPRQRNLLRHSYLDRMNIDQIGQVYQVHRATAARWLAQARDDLLQGTKEALRGRLEIDHEEYENLIQLIVSNLDVSIHSLLKSFKPGS